MQYIFRCLGCLGKEFNDKTNIFSHETILQCQTCKEEYKFMPGTIVELDTDCIVEWVQNNG